jgi:hypothetical protein
VLPKNRCGIIMQFITSIESRIMKCDIIHPCSYWPISSNMLLFFLTHSHFSTPSDTFKLGIWVLPNFRNH